MNEKMIVIIPIGGVGKRFSDEGYNSPKPLINSHGEPILFWNISNLKLSENDQLYIVYRAEFQNFNFENRLKNKFPKINFVFVPLENDTVGASETVLHALNQMSEECLKNKVVVVDSDSFYEDDIIDICRKEPNSSILFSSIDHEDAIYSYILFNDQNELIEIKEKKKISNNLCVGVYSFDSGENLKKSIEYILSNEKKQHKEYYISQVYNFLIKTNQKVKCLEINNFVCLGTPDQLKSFSSDFSINTKKLTFCFDLDNTLVTYPQINGDYTSVLPIQKTIDFCNFLYNCGHTIIIYTARRMKTHNNNIGKVIADVGKITLDTLEKFKISYHEIYFGKPFADFYIDDLSVSPYSDLEKETGFYKIHPKTRKHNKIEISDNFIIKKSTTIDGEKYYYNNIPKKLKKYFPDLIDEGTDFIKISKINGIPLSILNVNKTLDKKLFEKVLNTFKNIHSLPIESNINIYSNYYEKIQDRLKSYDFSEYINFDETKNKILNFLKNYEENDFGRIGIIHGDPVFTNILIDVNKNLKMIDMRGKVGDQLTIYGDIFYDYSKIYQSLIGYDNILMGKEIDTNYVKHNLEIFENFILKNYTDKNLINIKEITNSLLLSLIPLHDDEKCIKYYDLLISNLY